MFTSTGRNWIFFTVMGCLCSALMGVIFFAAHLEDTHFTSFAGSFIRVLGAAAFLILPILRKRHSHLMLPLSRHRDLWSWGVFGALTVTTYFAAVNWIGNGLTTLLSASNGIFIAALAPVIAGQVTSLLNWIGIFGAMGGMYLLCATGPTHPSYVGVALALASGFFGALAYLMVARSRKTYSSVTIMVTWCIVSLLFHLMIFIFYHVVWPTHLRAWLLLIGVGVTASVAQHFTTLAFQTAPASRVASLSYLTPVISLALDSFLFDLAPTHQSLVGAGLILAFGAALPLIADHGHAPTRT